MSTVKVNSAPGLERQVANLYDFSLDIARHDADLEFADSREDAVIHYVFDENVFEMFVQPRENVEYVVRDQVGRERDPDSASPRALTAMQSALFTGETLLGGQLPAQAKSGRCYVTQWHKWELLERINTFLGSLAPDSDESLSASVNDLILAKQRLLDDEASLDIEPAEDPLLGADLASLEAQFGNDPLIFRQFTMVRQLAAKLALDQSMEPIQQVNRLLQAHDEGRIEDVTEVVTPRREDWQGIRAAASRWHLRIRDEAIARAARHNAPLNKTVRAIWNDAQSLALVEWISRRLDPAVHRVVLVTGDATVFDAYRRVYEESPADRRSGAEPFLLRRPLQYSTLFSSGDASLAEPRRQLFYSLQQVVELPLAPLRVAVSESRLPADVLDRRQSLTLHRIGPRTNRTSYFHDAWLAYGSEYRAEEIADVQKQIDTLERILNGLSRDLVERRVGRDDRELHVRTRGLPPSERERHFRLFIDNAVDKLIRSSVELWRPHAETAFRLALVDGPLVTRRHVPLAVHLLGADGSGSRLASLLEAIFANRGEHGAPRLPKEFPIRTSFEIFIGGGAVALHGNEWRLGDHFCQIAINAFNYFSKSEGMSAKDAAEAHYLSALAKRFRLGELRPAENLRAHAAASRHFGRAIKLLKKSESLAPSEFSSFRSYSERAAISLFHSVLCAATADQLTGVSEQAEVQDEAEKVFREAGDYLLEAVRLQERAGFSNETPTLDGNHVERVRAQVLINAAAWYALQPSMWPKAPLDQYLPLARACTRSLQLVERMIERSGSSLFTAEMLGFKMSQGIDPERSAARMTRISASAAGSDLAIDSIVLRRITDHWAGRSPTRGG